MSTDLIFLPEGMHAAREISKKGPIYEVNTRSEYQREIKMLFRPIDEEHMEFAIFPNPLRPYTRDSIPKKEKRPFVLDLQVGATYHLDLRIASTFHEPVIPKQNYQREFVERCWYEYHVVDRPTDTTYTLDVKVRRIIRISRFKSGYITYQDTEYQLSEDPITDQNMNWPQIQIFRLTINRQGKVLKHQLRKDSTNLIPPLFYAAPIHFTSSAFQSKDKRPLQLAKQPLYLWSGLVPRPRYSSSAKNGAWAGLVDEQPYDLYYFDSLRLPASTIAEKRGRLTRYDLGNESVIVRDERNGWLKSGRIVKRNAEHTLEILLSGWSEKQRVAVITGQIINVEASAANLQKSIKRYLEFWQHLDVELNIDTAGNFRLVCDPGRILYEPKNRVTTLYLRPGDSLHIIRDFSRKMYAADISGDASVELTMLLKQNSEGDLVDLSDRRYDLEPDAFRKAVASWFQEKSEQLSSYKEQVDPVFYRKVEWDLRYRYANSLLLYWNHRNRLARSGHTSHAPADFLQEIQELPINNDEAVGLDSYRRFLEDHYLDYKTGGLRNFHRIYTFTKSLGETYAMAKYMYTGEPLFEVLTFDIKDKLYYEMISPEEAYPFLDDFRRSSRDTVLVHQLERAYKHLVKLEPGHRLPEFTIENAAGRQLVINQPGQPKTLFIPFGRNDLYLNSLDFDSLRSWYPDLRIVLLSFLAPDSWEDAAEEQQDLNPDLVYFIPDEKERREIHDYLHLYQFSFPRSSFRRAYFIDARGVIFDNFRATQVYPAADMPRLKEKLDRFTVYQAPGKISPQTIGIIIGSLSCGGLLAWLFGQWRARREKRRKQLIEMEIRSLRAQLNPHFIFNTMSSIQNLIASQKPELANDYLADLAGLMRKVLRYTQRGTISLDEELKMIRQYCALEYLRKPFELEIRNEADAFTGEIELPALILQPYVENALLHGLASLDGTGRIMIRIEPQEKGLLISIIDNGVGLQEAARKTSNGNHMGLKMNADRLKLFYGHAASVCITDRNLKGTGERGTIVELKIPRT